MAAKEPAVVVVGHGKSQHLDKELAYVGAIGFLEKSDDGPDGNARTMEILSIGFL